MRELSGTGEAPCGGEEKASSQSKTNQNQAEVSRELKSQSEIPNKCIITGVDKGFA